MGPTLWAKDGGQVLPDAIRGVNGTAVASSVKKDVCRIGSEDGVESLKLDNPDFGNIFTCSTSIGYRTVIIR